MGRVVVVGSRRTAAALAMVVLAPLAAAVRAVGADPVPTTSSITLEGGGAGGSEWVVGNTGGTTNGLPSGGSCENDPGWTIEDAELDPGNTTEAGNQDDAFDKASSFWVDNVQVVAPATADASPFPGPHQAVVAGPVQMSGLATTVEYRAMQHSATLRTLFTLTNSGAQPVTVTVTVAGNHGSDEDTLVHGTSSGDTAVTGADRWVVTSDHATAPSDTVNTYVIAGPGQPASPPASAGTVVFDCSGVEGLLATFGVTVPAGGPPGIPNLVRNCTHIRPLSHQVGVGW